MKWNTEKQVLTDKIRKYEKMVKQIRDLLPKVRGECESPCSECPWHEWTKEIDNTCLLAMKIFDVIGDEQV